MGEKYGPGERQGVPPGPPLQSSLNQQQGGGWGALGHAAAGQRPGVFRPCVLLSSVIAAAPLSHFRPAPARVCWA
jgi:hypothetical protein